MIEALTDVRSCTFHPELKLHKLMRYIERPEDIVPNLKSGFHLTPRFLEHFDFDDQFDHEVLRLKVHFFSFLLGFRLSIADVTGNL